MQEPEVVSEKDRDFRTVKEVAKRWRCHEQTVRDMVHSGRLKAYSITPPGQKRHRLLIDMADVTRLEAKSEVIEDYPDTDELDVAASARSSTIKTSARNGSKEFV